MLWDCLDLIEGEQEIDIRLYVAITDQGMHLVRPNQHQPNKIGAFAV